MRVVGMQRRWLLLLAGSLLAQGAAAAAAASGVGGSAGNAEGPGDEGTCRSASCAASEMEQAEAGELASMRSELLQLDLSRKKAPARQPANASAAVPGEIIEFYAFRAMSDKNYPPENVNMANLEGVLWYLHHEIVTQCPRKFDKTKIQRFKITYKTTEEMVAQGKNFGWRYAFDSGACSDFRRGCVRKDYKKNGYIVGCNDFVDKWAYPGNHAWDTNHYGANITHAYQKGIWYSFPGVCPDRKYWASHDYVCRKYTPGGKCDYPTGAHDCTYSMEAKGEVFLDQVIGQNVHGTQKWWCNRGCKEYMWNGDTGRCTNWWKGFWDVGRAEARLRAVRAAFEAKYPGEPELSDPVCDFDNPGSGYFRY